MKQINFQVRNKMLMGLLMLCISIGSYAQSTVVIPAACNTCSTTPTAGTITALNCASATNSGTLTAGTAASGVSSSVPYTGGNGGTYTAFSITSTGVTGLTASIAAGSFATGAGSLTVTISGTPSGAGTAAFALTLGGQSCTLSRTVVAAGIATVCPINTQTWLCHNLGADNTLDPHTPVVGLQGSYIKWGKTYNMSSTTNNGVAGFAAAPTAGNDNAGVISGWDMTEAADNAWNSGTEAAPVKTATDPCPSGYRVPTMTEFVNLINNTTKTITGTSWTDSPTNYGTMVHFGTGSTPKQLSFPMTGSRIDTGALEGRGFSGVYPSSSIMSSGGTSYAKVMPLGQGSATVPISTTSFWYKFAGFSVRCIAQ